MDKFLQYWEHIPSAHRILILLGGMILFWLLEGYYPLLKSSYRRYRHAGVNLIFLACTLILNLAFGFSTVRICDWVTAEKIGLIQWIQAPAWLTIILSLMFGDLFGQYIPHYLMHKVKWMWKFHLIHHSDTVVDVTTGTRHHPGEWLFRESFLILGVIVIGMPMSMYFLYRSVSALFTHFNHANIRVPLWLDKPISLLLVSPNMHKVHHHYVRPHTDTNYANIFSIWDRIFGTFKYADPRELKYGLDVLDDERSMDLKYQFRLPFDRNVKTDY